MRVGGGFSGMSRVWRGGLLWCCVVVMSCIVACCGEVEKVVLCCLHL